MALANTLIDGFTAGSRDATKWTQFGASLGTLPSQSGGQLVFTTSTTNGYGGYDSTGTWATVDLTANYVEIQLASAGNQSLTSLEVTPLTLILDANNNLRWYINSGTIQVFKKVATAQSSIFSAAYSSTTHKWLRIRESGGSTFFDYSADQKIWTNAVNLINPFAVTGLTVEMSAGTFANEASATTVLIDNFNVMPLASTLTDDFNDNSTDTTSKWTGNYNGTGNTITETNQQVVIALSGTSGAYSAYNTQPNTYDLTGSSVSVQAPVVTKAAATNSQSYIKVANNATNFITLGRLGANLLMQIQTAGVDSNTTITFDNVQHGWWQLIASGSNILMQTSPDGFAWTTQRTVTPSWVFTGVWIELGAGSFALDASPGTPVFDNFNTTISQPVVGNYKGGQVWRKKRRRFQRKQYFYPTPLLVNQVATPPTAALTITTFAPVVSTPRLVTPGKLSLIITPFIPTARAPRLATPGKLSLTITTFAPVVSAPRLVTPGKLSLILTTFAPTKLINNTRTPPTRTLTLTTFAPTVSAPRLVTPGKLALVLTTFIPLATNSRTVTINTLALTLTPYAPSIPPKYASIGTIITSSNRGEAVNTGISVAEIASSGTLETVPSSTNTSQVDSSETDEVISGTNTNTSI